MDSDRAVLMKQFVQHAKGEQRSLLPGSERALAMLTAASASENECFIMAAKVIGSPPAPLPTALLADRASRTAHIILTMRRERCSPEKASKPYLCARTRTRNAAMASP